ATIWEDPEIGQGTSLVSIRDSVTGLLYAYYLHPLAVLHDGSNLIRGEAFAAYFAQHLAPLGVPLVLHHAGLPAALAEELVQRGSATAVLTKPYSFEQLAAVVRQCLQAQGSA